MIDGIALHVVRERLHLDVGICVPAEMPEAALVVREHRIDRRIVEVQDFLAGIALVVLGDEIRQRAGNRRAVALGQDTNAGIYRLLRLDQALLRVDLVVERHDLDLLAENPALGIQFIGEELKGLQAFFANAGTATRQRVDVADFKGILGHSRRAEHRQREERSHHEFTHVNPPLSSLHKGKY